MIINFVGNFQAGPGGEPADETHMADALEGMGHTVRRVPRDIWKAHCDGEENSGWTLHLPLEDVDINIIAKWHHFNHENYVHALGRVTHAPVFYWVWDSVDLGIEWHVAMAQAADLYLSGELGRAQEFRALGIRFYYFQMDVVAEVGYIQGHIPKIYDVVYLGSCDNQNGRVDLLKAINKEVPIQVFGHDWEKWQAEGFTAKPAVYGEDANKVIAQAKIVLGTSCDPHLYGYWSNRVGRVLYAKGKLLQQYAPGMENFLHDWVEYFSTPEEAVEKITALRATLHTQRAYYERVLFTSNQKMRDFIILAERFIKEDHGRVWQLP